MKHHQRRRTRHAAVTLALFCACSLGLGACSPTGQARRSMAEGDPVQAVRFYEKAVRSQPGDAELAAEHALAQREASAVLVDRSGAALAAGREDEAIRLARAADGHDPVRPSRESRMRHAVARLHLHSAEDALATNAFEIARNEAERAHEFADDLPEAAALLARINAAQASRLAEGAIAFAESGQYRRALVVARHAAELTPDDEAIVALPVAIDRMRREAAFDALYVEALGDLDARRLTSLARRLGELAGLDVRRDTLAELTQLYVQQRELLDAVLAEAHAARERGDFAEASRQYAAAAGLVADRPDIKAEQAACEVDGRVHRLLREGELNMRQARFAEATESFRQALLVRADATTEARYRDAEASHHQKELYRAMDRDDHAAAVRHLTALLRVAPDETSELILYRLEIELVDAALADAAALHADGQTARALTVLEAAMKEAHDQQLIDLHAVLSAERLAQEAVEADAAGDFELARSLYLKALARDPDRRGLAERLHDLGMVAEVRRNYERSRRQATKLDEALRDRQQVIGDLRQQLAAQQKELTEAERNVTRLQKQTAGSIPAIDLLNQRIAALEQEVAALTRDATFWRGEADRWRKKYEEKEGGGAER